MTLTLKTTKREYFIRSTYVNFHTKEKCYMCVILKNNKPFGRTFIFSEDQVIL